MDKRKYADRREYLSKATNIRRLRMKKKLVDIKGGECQICGYSRCLVALDFHHIDESTKEFELSQRDLTRKWEKIVEEAKKCLLVCANCHREIHAGIVVLDKLGGILVK
jgi:hypothetical protein